MDFLDPRKKKARTTRLLIGYFLMAIAIGLGTIILVYGANGYGIDTKTGQITQSGLLFADSKPGGANIFLNSVDQKTTTSARMILNAGQYELSLQKPGYRGWTRSFTLDENSIERYVYPFLFPDELKPVTAKTYPTAPQFSTITPDRRFLLIQNQSNPKQLSFDMFDTGEINQPSRPVILPITLLTSYSADTSKITEVEWAADDTHLLAKHSYQGGTEYIIIDRTNPTDSLNINKTLKTNPSQVVLKDKKDNELYVYDSVAKTLRVANVNQKTLGAVLINDVYAFKTYGRTLISYITSKGAPPGKMLSKVWDDGKTYPLNSVNAGSEYFLDIAEFQSHWYYVASSNTDERVAIYRDPLEQVRAAPIKAAHPMIAFDITDTKKISFSANTRFLNVQAGQKFGVYDFEADQKFQYDMPLPLAGPMVWMDGHRLIGNSGGFAVVMDYDATNTQVLNKSLLTQGGYFSRDYNQLYSLVSAEPAAGTNLIRVDMRTGNDLPSELR